MVNDWVNIVEVACRVFQAPPPADLEDCTPVLHCFRAFVAEATQSSSSAIIVNLSLAALHLQTILDVSVPGYFMLSLFYFRNS